MCARPLLGGGEGGGGGGESPGDEASYTCDKRLRNSILKTLIKNDIFESKVSNNVRSSSLFKSH